MVIWSHVVSWKRLLVAHRVTVFSERWVMSSLAGWDPHSNEILIPHDLVTPFTLTSNPHRQIISGDFQL